MTRTGANMAKRNGTAAAKQHDQANGTDWQDCELLPALEVFNAAGVALDVYNAAGAVNSAPASKWTLAEMLDSEAESGNVFPANGTTAEKRAWVRGSVAESEKLIASLVASAFPPAKR